VTAIIAVLLALAIGFAIGFSSPRAAGSNDSTSDGRRGRVGRGMHTAIVVVIGFALLGLCLALA
jgi:hypothetical protein